MVIVKDSVFVPVQLIAASLKKHEEYDLRNWILLRDASSGKGHCQLSDFRTYLRGLGYRRTAIEGIVSGLISQGLARRSRNKGGYQVLKHLSLMQICARYQLLRVSERVQVNHADLKGKGLRHRFFAYVEAGLSGRPISRETLETLTGVSKPTQRRGERRMGAQVKPNYLRVEMKDLKEKADLVPCNPENGCRRSFRSGDSLMIQMPNSYSFPAINCKKRKLRIAYADCQDILEWQTTGRRQYHTDLKKFGKIHLRFGQAVEARHAPFACVYEGTIRRGTVTVGTWGL